MFNLQHTSARNVIEWIFGIVKQCFCILLLAPEFDIDIETHISCVLCALHNFICHHDPDDTDDKEYKLAADISHIQVNGPGIGQLAASTVSCVERDEVSIM